MARKINHSLSWLLLLIALLGACSQPKPRLPSHPWAYEDLRALDVPQKLNPQRDLIALYTREASDAVEIRLDLLDTEFVRDFDLYLALDHRSGGVLSLPIDQTSSLAWDTLVNVPSEGSPAALDTGLEIRTDLLPRVVQDPDQDTLIISLNSLNLPLDQDHFQVEAYLTAPGSEVVIDQLGPADSQGPNPPRAPLLLAFWNTFPAYTPAQALRRWAGAHTGPFGERHGLQGLINAARLHKTPLTLLDLKSPTSLSALDFLDVLREMIPLTEAGTLVLPEIVPVSAAAASGQVMSLPPENALEAGLEWSQITGNAFGLPKSRFLYAPLLPEGASREFKIIFLPPRANKQASSSPALSPITQWEGSSLVRLPPMGDTLQASPEGLPVSLRKLFHESAFSGQSIDRGGAGVVILGGSLPESSWGDPGLANRTLGYIANHPWIWVLGEADLLRLKPLPGEPPDGISPLPTGIPYNSMGSPIPSGLSTAEIQDRLLTALADLPSSELKDTAWAAYFAFLAPNPPETDALPALRAGYLGQVGKLVAAASWAADPYQSTDCTADPDLDGEPECILASESCFAVIEPSGARLTHLFARSNRRTHQIIGPFSQFIIGLGDPGGWNPSLGPAGDPGDVPGAFSDLTGRWTPYHPQAREEEIEFTSERVTLRKTFSLTPEGVLTQYDLPDQAQFVTQLPLALSPNTRFHPNWWESYSLSRDRQRLSWGPEGVPHIRITTTAALSAYPFSEPGMRLAFPEDPNFDYPPGHYIPFPMVLVEVMAEDDFEVLVRCP